MLSFTISYAGSDADLIRFVSPIIDAHPLPDGTVRLYSQRLDVYDANKTEHTFTRINPEIAGAKIRRVSQVLLTSSSVLAFGHIVTYDAAASVVLRSTDMGKSFTPIVVGTDTMAITDGCTLVQGGQLLFVDRVGRLWKSDNDGLTWVNKRWPTGITPGAAREVDMIDAKTGVCIDGIRGIHFTTDGWNSIITPVPAHRPILRTQPSMIFNSGWTRSFVLLNNTLYLTEGPDTYRTASNDLIWERWDSVATFSFSSDRKRIAFYTTDSRLVMQDANGSNTKVLGNDVLPPHFIRVFGDTVLTYRPDTGPTVYTSSGITSVRPLLANSTITQPTLLSTNSDWGILTNAVDAVLVDVLNKDGKGLWHRDTVAAIGPVRSVYSVGRDTLVFNTNRNAMAYLPNKRTITPYTVKDPLALFMQQPVVRFRLLFASDELDSTHVRWVEYVTQDTMLVCAELVDSSSFGVRSQLVTKRFGQSEIRNLLASINAMGETPPSASFVTITPGVLEDYHNILDTIFSTDAYFDQFDMYKPPPAAEEQARSCLNIFARVADEIPTLSPETIADALRAFRHVPHDGHSRYVAEFQNRAGRIARFMVDRADEAHPPLMLPWRGYFNGNTWSSYNRGLTSLMLKGLPEDAIPPMFKELSKDSWFLLGVASYIDAMRYGRRHRWSNRSITPAANFKVR